MKGTLSLRGTLLAVGGGYLTATLIMLLNPVLREMDAARAPLRVIWPYLRANFPNIPNFSGMRNSGKFPDQHQVEAGCRTHRPGGAPLPASRERGELRDYAGWMF